MRRLSEFKPLPGRVFVLMEKTDRTDPLSDMELVTGDKPTCVGRVVATSGKGICQLKIGDIILFNRTSSSEIDLLDADGKPKGFHIVSEDFIDAVLA